ncbi:MAG TPA: pyridoxal-phosphate dependent enzyme, partial [Thermococcus sp.]|nr:pyridoxal-phosphate dependent enzyme [Thermococcus sp.]
MKLVCPICGKTYEEPVQRCECGEPVEFEAVHGEPYIGKSVWERFYDFWPVEPALEFSLGEGDTPLVRSRLGEEIGVNLYLKNETVNPTWSFKDRGTFLAMSYALKAGYKGIAFEIAEEVSPDYVLIPTSSGGLFRGIAKG